MKEPFVVSPTESLLMGLCLGRYLRNRGDGGESFDEVVEWWVKPFVSPTWPPLVFEKEEFKRAAERNRRITEGDDEGIEEDGEDIEDYLGRVMQSNEHSETFELGREFGRALAICEEYTERLARLDYPCLWKAALEGKHLIPRGDDTMLFSAQEIKLMLVGQRLLQDLGREPTTEELVAAADLGAEDARRLLITMQASPDVDPAIEIEESAWQPALDWLLRPDELEDYEAVIKRLNASRLVQQSMYAYQCLTDCSLPVMQWFSEGGTSTFRQSRAIGSSKDGLSKHRHLGAIAEANRSRAMLWLAFGELLGFQREADGLAKMGEWASGAPRSVRELFDPSGKRVRDAIRDAELVLSTDTSEDALAKALGFVVNGIEALAKRIWPIDESCRRLTDLLLRKAKTGTEDEKRFGYIALGLYQSYRNACVHDFETFHCSVTEARFFVSGMHTLSELADRISATGKGDK